MIKARCAVERMHSQRKLYHAARKAKFEEVRLAAIEKLTDQKALAHIAVGKDDWELRAAAVKRMTNQALLEQVCAQLAEDERVLPGVIQRLENDEALFWIATHTSVFEAPELAIERMRDPRLLARYAVLYSHLEYRSDFSGLIAVQKLSDQDLLLMVAMQAHTSGVVDLAVERITRQDYLIKVIERRWFGAEAAACNPALTDREWLNKLAEGDDEKLRESARRNINYAKSK